ncbi:anion permease [Sinorhizobium numidicum]|uniref:Anion permease n=1 Tax=Sinorhizobium numidicum TaxID=680248 RepID=A0ABY8CNS3_9HYPH|nr:SLC13 family permease [Sinorhizobium numidicum]WEX74327.1 anion permease [Sinorhizobium numidicum]WEX80314.1 anion permease [Sinorhizobium numidicum]
MLHSVPSTVGTVSELQGAGARRAWSLRPVAMRSVFGLLLLQASVFVILYGFDGLPIAGRLSLSVFVGALIAWVVLGLPDTPVALAGALVLVVSGAVGEDALFATLGSEIVWLLIAAFVLASALRSSGTAERAAAAVLRRCRTVAGVFWGATLMIALTAFVIPSTSARAAILMPVFFGLSAAIARPTVIKGLALLFPSVILLSACASMTGAGAHLIAADFMRHVGGADVNFARWVLLGAPFALITSLIACGMIQLVFLSSEDRRAPVGTLPVGPRTNAGNEAALLTIVGATVLLWATSALHGQNIAIVALAAALLAGCKSVSGISLKDALKGVEWNLLLFLAATLLIGEALLTSGAARYLIDQTLAGLQGRLAPDPWMVVTLAALVSSLAHILITSRTVRASVLIPAVALPLSAFGADPAALIFVTAVGSGFCQTLMVSAKPVALFGSAETPPFTQGDLLRLAAFLLPLFIGLLVAFALFIWPPLGLPFETIPATPGSSN